MRNLFKEFKKYQRAIFEPSSADSIAILKKKFRNKFSWVLNV